MYGIFFYLYSYKLKNALRALDATREDRKSLRFPFLRGESDKIALYAPFVYVKRLTVLQYKYILTDTCMLNA